MDEKILPKTAKALEKIEESFAKFGENWELIKTAPEDEVQAFMNPMLYLAGVISVESPDWSEELGKYLCIVNGIKSLDVKINVDKT